jgi:hypothetical protein
VLGRLEIVARVAVAKERYEVVAEILFEARIETGV